MSAQVADDLAKVTIFVANRFKLDWIRAQYSQRLALLMERLTGQAVQIELALAPRETVASKSEPKVATAAALAETLAEADHFRPAEPLKSRLNTALTFDTLVEGSANRMARAAAMHVAGMPGHLYNPLFIYGGVGLGKTHLMHAVGNQLMADHPSAKVLYIHAEQFVTDVVKAYQRKAFDEFKERYHSLDLLLIDDVQFFANKERTQEEFFNAFEALLAKKSHIVMTSDTYPKGLADIHERLVSRFDSGLTVAIEPPELEMRVAILINKAQAEGIVMPEEVAFFVAKNVRSNVRELEGALRKILAYSRFQPKRNFDLAGARGVARPAFHSKPPDFGGKHPENRGGLLQDQDRRHVFQEAAGQHCPAAPDCHVPGQGTDAKKPARNRRNVWRARPHHGLACGAKNRRRAPADDRTQPAIACAGANAQRLTNENEKWENNPFIHKPV